MSTGDEKTTARIVWNGPAVLFAAAALAFLLPFGTVSCGGEEVAFTGLQLATMQVPPDPKAAPDPDGGLAAEIEVEAGAWAFLALVLVAGGLGSALVRGCGGGFAFGSTLSLLILLFSGATSYADVSVRGGFWLALASVVSAGVLRVAVRLRARRRRKRSAAPALPRRSRWRRLAPPVLYALAALVVLVIGAALAPSVSY